MVMEGFVGCLVPVDDKTTGVFERQFEILMSYNRLVDWHPIRDVNPDEAAFTAGMDQDGKEIFICRTALASDNKYPVFLPGRWIRETGKCRLKDGFLETDTYDVLLNSWAKKSTALNDKWVPATGGRIPEHAFKAGWNQRIGCFNENYCDGGVWETYYACRAEYKGGTHLGKAGVGFENLNGCQIEWGDKGIFVARYDVLTSLDDAKWMSAKKGHIPENAVVGGEEDGNAFYVCRGHISETDEKWWNIWVTWVSHMNGWHPGKIRKGFNGCYISNNYRAVVVKKYEVLTW